MEDPSEVQCEENAALPEKNKKRQFKTPSQLQGLEDFYKEHKYPTESLKAEFAVKLGLTEKQVSGWFCHRRLKDKRIMNGDINPSGRQDLSSGVIQDRGSGLKQDSCGSTKQGDYKLADLREVESRRFCHNGLPVAEINYEQRVVDDGMEMDDTSSESDSALQESFYPHNRIPLVVETADYRTPNVFVAQNQRRMGPSGYLKIKGQTENVAVTSVKRQLGRQYREDGPPLGIEFDPLPPEAFESPSKNANTDSYGDPETIGSGPLDIAIIHKRPGLNIIQSEDMYIAPTNYRSFHKSDPDSFSYRQPKQKSPYLDHGHVFPGQKSLCVDPCSARETSEYDDILNCSILQTHNLSGTGSDCYGGKFTSETEEPLWHNYDNGNSLDIQRKEKFDSRGAAPSVRHRDALNKEERVLPSRKSEDEELNADKRTISEHLDSVGLKILPQNELRGDKKGREEFLQEDFPIRPSSQVQHQWSRQIRGSTEWPSSFSEDETAETSSSME